MPHPNSLRNLCAPWRPGEVPNPKGINRKRPYTDRLFERAEALLPEEMRAKINVALERQFGRPDMLAPGTTYADAQTLRLHLDAIMGDIRAAEFISDRVEGKPPNRLDLIGHERQEITIRVVEDPPLPHRDRIEAALFRDIVVLIERSSDDEDESFLTKAVELAQIIKQRAQAKGRTIDVPAR
jgi:hypothetical protein